MNASRKGVQAALASSQIQNESRRRLLPFVRKQVGGILLSIPDSANSKRYWSALAVLLVLALTLWLSCSKRPSDTAPSNTASTHSVTDDAGRQIVVPAHIERLVSLAPSLTEIVYAVGAGGRLIGDTTYCDY